MQICGETRIYFFGTCFPFIQTGTQEKIFRSRFLFGKNPAGLKGAVTHMSVLFGVFVLLLLQGHRQNRICAGSCHEPEKKASEKRV